MLLTARLLRNYNTAYEPFDRSECCMCPPNFSLLMRMALPTPDIPSSPTLKVLVSAIIGIGIALDHDRLSAMLIATGVSLWGSGTFWKVMTVNDAYVNLVHGSFFAAESAFKALIGLGVGYFANDSFPLPIRCVIPSVPCSLHFPKNLAYPYCGTPVHRALRGTLSSYAIVSNG